MQVGKKLVLGVTLACATQVLAGPASPLLRTAWAQEAPAPETPAPEAPAPEAGAVPFRLTSEERWVMQGKFVGLLRLGGEQVELELEEADVFLGKTVHATSRRLLHSVTFCLAGLDAEGRWDIVQVGTAVPIDQVLKADDKLALGPLTATIPVAGRDLSKHWIVIKFGATNLDTPEKDRVQAFSFVHTDRKIFAPAP